MSAGGRQRRRTDDELGDVRLITSAPPGWHAYNPSIARTDDGFVVLVRLANYMIQRDSYVYETSDGGLIRNAMRVVHLSSDLAHRGEHDVVVRAAPMNRAPHQPESGYEDGRIINVDGDWFVVAATREFHELNYYETALLKLDDRWDVDEVSIISRSPQGHEKNWMPVFGERGFGTVDECWSRRSWEPTRFRGGSQLIPFDGGWLAVVHEIVLSRRSRRVYLHRWAWFDEDFELVRWSLPFTLVGESIEFCAGLAWYDDDRLIVSYGVWDRQALLRVVSADEARQRLEEVRYASRTIGGDGALDAADGKRDRRVEAGSRAGRRDPGGDGGAD